MPTNSFPSQPQHAPNPQAERISSSKAANLTIDDKHPLVVICGLQMGANSGSIARAMANMGWSALHLVRPRTGWLDAQARAMAAGADAILDRAVVYDDLDMALANIDHCVATTARPRDLSTPAYPLDQALGMCMDRCRHEGIIASRIAFMFGNEQSGLSNDEVARCNMACWIEGGSFSSLNLAQAVLLVAYGFNAHMRRAGLDVGSDPHGHLKGDLVAAQSINPSRQNHSRQKAMAPASMASLKVLESLLAEGFDDRAPAARRHALKSLLQQRNWREGEVHLLCGLIRRRPPAP